MAKSMIGIDAGVCELKIAVWDGKKVKKLLSIPMLENLVKDGVIVSYDAMADFIRESLRGTKISGQTAVILPSNYTFLKRLSLPKMTRQQLEVNLPYEFRDFLTLGKDKYFYDYAVNTFVKNEEGEGESMDLLAACVEKQVIGDYRDMLRRCGYKLGAALPIECVYLNIIRAQKGYEDKEFAFVDFGHSSTRLYVFNGAGYEVTRVVDIGMKTVCDAIAEQYGVDTRMALSHLQVNFENCQAQDGPRNVYDAIAGELRKAINFYSFNNRDSNLTEIWCCGGGYHNSFLKAAVEEGTELKLRSVAEILPECPEGTDPAAFACAIGAAMQGGK